MLLFVPGTVVGGMHEHDCPTSRAVGYYLEPVVALAPFAKTPLVLTLRGITSDNRDVGVDAVRTGMLPLLRHWGVEEGIELKVAKRGAPPRGGGEVRFVCPPVKALRPVQLTEAGRIKRIRGIACVSRAAVGALLLLLLLLMLILGEVRLRVAHLRACLHLLSIASSTHRGRFSLTSFLMYMCMLMCTRGLRRACRLGFHCRWWPSQHTAFSTQLKSQRSLLQAKLQRALTLMWQARSVPRHCCPPLTMAVVWTT